MAEHKVEKAQGKKKEAESGKRRDGVVTVVLTADNHLGFASFGQHPRKREERQQKLRRAFQQATDFAIVQGVDLFIQAGDLFDTTTPDERDRSFVAARLAQLKQVGVRTFAQGGVHDTPVEGQPLLDEVTPAPQMSYARLGALHYFPPLQPGKKRELEPAIVDIDGVLVGICGLGVLAGQEGDPLASVRIPMEIERAAIPILLLHAPIEGLSLGTSLLDTRAQVSQASIEEQTLFRHILAGYHHGHTRVRIGQTDVVVAGATQHVDFTAIDHAPGFVFLGLAADGIRWCNHISVDSLQLQCLAINTRDLWSENAEGSPTDNIFERLHPLCNADTMIQLRLEGELTRRQYHELDLNRIRHYGEEHCFALAIDDSALLLLPDTDSGVVESGERFSPREELIALADEWIAASTDEKEQKALQVTKEDLLLAMDEIKGKR